MPTIYALEVDKPHLCTIFILNSDQKQIDHRLQCVIISGQVDSVYNVLLCLQNVVSKSSVNTAVGKDRISRNSKMTRFKENTKTKTIMHTNWGILLVLVLGCSCRVIAQNSTNSTETNDVNITTTVATTAGPTLSPELQKLMDYAVSLVEQKFTSVPFCKLKVTQIIQAQTSVEGSCTILCMAKGGLWESQQCNTHDYDLLKNGLCGNYTCPTHPPVTKPTSSPEEKKRHRENVMCVIDNQLSSEECMHTAQSQAEGRRRS
ncbi:hypothetical protein Btru_037949 [Bulinus truncatus]|nr:hypothetical protein Btru_037949 [Bulinus truncatus]